MATPTPKQVRLAVLRGHLNVTIPCLLLFIFPIGLAIGLVDHIGWRILAAFLSGLLSFVLSILLYFQRLPKWQLWALNFVRPEQWVLLYRHALDAWLIYPSRANKRITPEAWWPHLLMRYYHQVLDRQELTQLHVKTPEVSLFYANNWGIAFINSFLSIQLLLSLYAIVTQKTPWLGISLLLLFWLSGLYREMARMWWLFGKAPVLKVDAKGISYGKRTYTLHIPWHQLKAFNYLKNQRLLELVTYEQQRKNTIHLSLSFLKLPNHWQLEQLLKLHWSRHTWQKCF